MQENKIAEQLMKAAFTIGAIKIEPRNPFTWASGRKSPIYNDNRLLLSNHELMKLVIDGFTVLCTQHSCDHNIVGGIATAGIPHAYGLAARQKLPFFYVRDKPKDHGMKNRIEGIPADGSLQGKSVVLIEDLISTGGSSVSAVHAVREAKGYVEDCFSIFSYGLPEAKAMFAGEIPFDKEGTKLSTPCSTDSIIRYDQLIAYGINNGYVKGFDDEILYVWAQDPKAWHDKWIQEHPESI